MKFSKQWAIMIGLLCIGISMTQACPTAKFVRKMNMCKRQQIDYSDGILLVKHVQRALKAGRVLEVSDYVSFPLRVNRGGEKYAMVSSRNVFVSRYDSIFTPSVRRRIAAADPNDIFCSYRGGTAGDGVIWFEQKDHLKIYAINQ